MDALLSPAVTITVIALLTFIIVLQELDHKRRMRELTRRLGRLSGAMLASLHLHYRKEMERSVRRAAEFTYDIMAKREPGDTSLEGAMGPEDYEKVVGVRGQSQKFDLPESEYHSPRAG